MGGALQARFRSRRASRRLAYLLALLLSACFPAIAAGQVQGPPIVPPGLVALEGTVEVLHVDEEADSHYLYFLQTARERLELKFDSNPPALVSGSRIRARGLRRNGVLALTSGGSTETLASALPHTFNTQPTLVMLVNFQDNPSEPYTVDYARGVMQTTSDFDLENSFQQTELAGVVDGAEAADVRGWYTIPVNSNNCDYYGIANYARQAAAADGVVLSDYGRYVYAFPNNSGCGWWGLGTVGGWPSQAWVNGSLQLRVVGHEMGHNFGLYHSHYLSCNGAACSASEYGDSWDIMGASSGHFNAYQKERLGWLDYNVSPPITTVQADGVYWIGPYEAPNSDPKALKVLKSTDPNTGKSTYYYVEYRARLGFDSGLSNAVILHSGSESSANSSYLWDLDQDTSTADWVLNVGQSYTDDAADVTITLMSQDSTGADVSVTFGGTTPCVPSSPLVSLNPSAVQWSMPGTTESYTVTVTNRDSSACTSSTFDLAASAPNGWTASFNSSSLTLGPGGSGSRTLQLTSPASAGEQLYYVPVSATKNADATSSDSETATLMLTSTIDVTVGTSCTTCDTNSTMLVTVTAKDGQDLVGAAGASATVTLWKSDGTSDTNYGTVGNDGTLDTNFKILRKDPTGSWQVQAVVNLAGISGNDSEDITVTGGNGGGGGNKNKSTGGGGPAWGKGGKLK